MSASGLVLASHPGFSVRSGVVSAPHISKSMQLTNSNSEFRSSLVSCRRRSWTRDRRSVAYVVICDYCRNLDVAGPPRADRDRCEHPLGRHRLPP